jgi:hypothetical protein
LLLVVLSVFISAGVVLQRSTSIVGTAIPHHLTATERERELALTHELDETIQDLRRRIELKDRLVAELLAGRATLADVTAQFLAMNQGHPEHMAVVRSYYAGATDTERTARNVMNYSEPELAHYRPIRRIVVLARLELQLRELVAHESLGFDALH